MVYLRHGDPALAQQVLERLLEREPGNTSAMSNLVQALQVQGRVADDAFSDQLDTIAATWAVNGARVCADAVFDSAGITTCDNVFVAADATTITLTATDPEGQTATASVEVVVRTNAAPTAEIVAPVDGGSFYSDTPIVFDARVDDAEDPPDALTVEWDSSVDGILPLDAVPTSSGQISGSARLTQGDHFLTLTVTDSTGRTGEAKPDRAVTMQFKHRLYFEEIMPTNLWICT